MLIPLEFKVIPHSEQRYPTVGDYFEKDGINHFRVSDMGNDDYEFLVFIHEVIEQYVTQRNGISEEEISKFDIEFENNRQDGNTDEPGDSGLSPYREEHKFATIIEKFICENLGIDWDKYDDTVNNL